LKIALTCPASLPATQFGGILFLCVDIARELSKKNHKITIYTTDLDFANNPKTFNKKLSRRENVTGFEISRSHVWFSVGLFFVNPGMYFQILKDDTDLIHSIGVRSFQTFIAALVSKKKNIPLIISDQGGLTTHPDLHDNNYFKKLLYKFQLPMIKFIINQSSKIIAANEYEKKIFLNFCDPEKIVIIRNGVNIEDIKKQKIDFRKKYEIKNPFFLFLGRFNKIKGIDILLEAINFIKNEAEMSDHKLVIMGADFGFEDDMKRMIDDFGIQDKIVIIQKPPREDVISAYRESNFLVLPSRWELSPLTPLEGFVFKKPVISTNVHGIPYTIINQKHGILVEPEDPRSLGSAILTLLRDKKKCSELGLAGFELVQNFCNSQKMAENTLKIYEEIINR